MRSIIKKQLKYIYALCSNFFYFLLALRSRIATKWFVKPLDINEIPIVINNRNRYEFLKMLIESLEQRGYRNIIILDNNSTWPPLLGYYKSIPYKVVYLGKNLGYNALEKLALYKTIRKNYFVYTDPDILPVENCPDDFLSYFMEVLKRYPKVQKVGFALKIDDLPDHFADKHKVIEWESALYKKPLESGIYQADIDTTFALHRPYAVISTRGNFKMIRTGDPYMAYHMPWYNDSANLSDEEQFYLDNVEVGTWWSKGLKLKKNSFLKWLFNSYDV